MVCGCFLGSAFVSAYLSRAILFCILLLVLFLSKGQLRPGS